MNAAELGAWVRAMRARSEACRFQLRHLTWAADGEASVPVAELAADDAKALASEALASAREDARDTGGPQRYMLAATTPDGVLLGRKVWRVAGELTSPEAAAPSEPPTPAGITAQLMRHKEAGERLLHLSLGTSLS